MYECEYFLITYYQRETEKERGGGREGGRERGREGGREGGRGSERERDSRASGPAHTHRLNTSMLLKIRSWERFSFKSQQQESQASLFV